MSETVLRIVLTGAPASGKTVYFERWRQLPIFQQFIFFEEMARRLLDEDPGWRDKWHEFHLEIYRRQVAQEAKLVRKSFVTDRGTVDAFAFHPETMSDIGTNCAREYRRYDLVFHLGSTARLGEKYYQPDEIRNETIEETLWIEDRISSVWKSHPGYHFVAAEIEMDVKYEKLMTLVDRLTNED